MKVVLAVLLITYSLAGWGQMAHVTSDNTTIAGDFLIEPPTLLCVGFEWKIKGDKNRNAVASVFFRKKGEVSWRAGLPLLRIGGEKTPTVWKVSQNKM